MGCDGAGCQPATLSASPPASPGQGKEAERPPGQGQEAGHATPEGRGSGLHLRLCDPSLDSGHPGVETFPLSSPQSPALPRGPRGGLSKWWALRLRLPPTSPGEKQAVSRKAACQGRGLAATLGRCSGSLPLLPHLQIKAMMTAGWWLACQLQARL